MVKRVKRVSKLPPLRGKDEQPLVPEKNGKSENQTEGKKIIFLI